MFTVVARGNVLFNQYVSVEPGQRSRNVKFMPTFDMVPQATIYVHYLVDGVMRFDERKIDFEKDFGNSVGHHTEPRFEDRPYSPFTLPNRSKLQPRKVLSPVSQLVCR